MLNDRGLGWHADGRSVRPKRASPAQRRLAIRKNDSKQTFYQARQIAVKCFLSTLKILGNRSSSPQPVKSGCAKRPASKPAFAMASNPRRMRGRSGTWRSGRGKKAKRPSFGRVLGRLRDAIPWDVACRCMWKTARWSRSKAIRSIPSRRARCARAVWR